jgi:excinuclease ABC subunit A
MFVYLLPRYRSEFLCPSCEGSRLSREASFYKVQDRTLQSFWELPVSESLQSILSLEVPKETEVIKKEIVSRLRYLSQVGLSYLSLDRQARTLSGGEFQRVNLTTILGTNLVNTTLVLDEPTIGLHPRDTTSLIGTIKELKDRGNSVIVVEHDPEVIQSADRIYEIGPSSGLEGGMLVFEGEPSALYGEKTKTGLYLDQVKNNVFIYSDTPSVKGKANSFKIEHATANNLKNITVSIPKSCFTVLSGVSGSGKSSLVYDCLYLPASKEGLQKEIKGAYSSIQGLDSFKEVVLIDQQPIGKTSRANPGTYTKAWDEFRDYLADTEAAVQLGLSKSSFSFNVDGGRCPVCKGNGTIKVEMQFLTDVQIECEVCQGRRFLDQVLAVRLGNKNVYEWLQSPVQDVVKDLEILPDEKRNRKIYSLLEPLINLGLGYIPLGHSLSNLSGGEAQRLKLASFISGKNQGSCLIILDEPSTGLHPSDITFLMKSIQSLVGHGHTVLCVEHNLDIIRAADWLIEIGPEGGKEGGYLLVEGSPFELVKDTSIKSPTLEYLRKSFTTPNSVSTKRTRKHESKDITIIGGREHNLKNITVTIPEKTLTVVTGVSGSGKSTLAFDILFSEGQRRFIDCLSPYAKQYIKQTSRPDVDQVSGIPPTIAVSQKTAPPHGISTLGTVTEVYQYLRLLFSKVGTQRCVKDGTTVSDFSPERLVDEVLRRYNKKRIFIFAPVVSGRKGHYSEVFQRAVRAEVTEARIDGSFVSISEETKLDRHKLHWISLLAGKVTVSEKNKEMVSHAVSQALVLSGGAIEICLDDPYSDPEVFSTERVCPSCKTGYMPLDPQDFSFRSMRGMCQSCGGRGYVTGTNERMRMTCPSCEGSRLGPIGRNVTLFDHTIHELSLMTAPELSRFFETSNFPDRLQPVVAPLVGELLGILSLIDKIGLGYLSLDRDASTLSGGEAQRLRLAKSFGAPLSGVCYVLDEPSIGLHASDHEQLMMTLREMRDQGNTVIVVEHDEDTIRDADYIIDIGPEGGSHGGHLVHAGSVKDLLKNKESVTGKALQSRTDFSPRKSDRKEFEYISLSGITKNNLKDISVSIPKGALTVVVGVSGAGKSSLVHGALYPAILESFEGEEEREKISDKHWDTIDGLDSISRLTEIDQNSIGKTPASTPASFLGVFNLIRDIFAELPEAKVRGFTPSYFSYNRGGGRCLECEGRGYITIPMSFLPDAKTLCEACNGLRYGEEALEVKLQGYSIGAILKMTISDAYEVFSSYARVKKSLEYALQLGIGYITLGQASHTLSGGEAQRLKIAKELGKREAKDTLYLLDEPTIGLHMVDVDKLLSVLHLLVAQNNTILVIEHNLDVLLSADYIIELGPVPGDSGGELLFEGTLEAYLKCRKKTPTIEQVRRYLKK